MSKQIKAIIIGIVTTLLVFLLIGIPTALIKTPYYTRMIGSTSLDYFFLIAISLLIGGYVSIHYYDKVKNLKKGDYLASGGAILSIFAVGCPICSTILVSLLGTGFILAYFEPFRPLIGIVSILLISTALYIRIKHMKK